MLVSQSVVVVPNFFWFEWWGVFFWFDHFAKLWLVTWDLQT